MKKTSVTTVFFGSGPVAAASLARLQEWCTVEAVITKPRPPHHRGPVPVLDMHPGAFTVSNKRELSELIASQNFTSRLGVVIDFGIIIAQDVIDSFELGIVNSHFSLLPEWRGADPITFSVLSGQQQTGVSLMLIDDKMDEGPLLAQATYDLPADITTPRLTEDLIELSDAALKEVLPRYLAGDIDPAPQASVTLAESTEPSYSRKLTKSDSILDFAKPAVVLEREIRAFADWPKSRAKLLDTDVIITAAHVSGTAVKPGEIEVHGKRLLIGCGIGTLSIDRLKPAGKKDMPIESFLAGYSK
jgi:methionyl-tRNA formyltransferase